MGPKKKYDKVMFMFPAQRWDYHLRIGDRMGPIQIRHSLKVKGTKV